MATRKDKSAEKALEALELKWQHSANEIGTHFAFHRDFGSRLTKLNPLYTGARDEGLKFYWSFPYGKGETDVSAVMSRAEARRLALALLTWADLDEQFRKASKNQKD